jgi:hypothetical protein
MDFQQLLNHIMLLPQQQKQVIMRMLDTENLNIPEQYYNHRLLRQTPEWKEMENRVQEVFGEERPCLVHFDDHLTSLNS